MISSHLFSQVVLTPARFLYFDHSQEHDFNERGLNWAEKYTDIKKTFGYSPPSNQNILGKVVSFSSTLTSTDNYGTTISLSRERM